MQRSRRNEPAPSGGETMKGVAEQDARRRRPGIAATATRGALAAALLAGCALGPAYVRPTAPMTTTFRGQAEAEVESFADLPWWDVFRDPTLAALIREALANSYDLQDAVARVEVARENAGVATDALLPSISVQAAPSYQQIFSPFSVSGRPSGNFSYKAYTVGASLSWEIDLWGRLRRLREAALASFLASEDNRRGVIVSLIGSVATSYFNLLSLDLQLAVARRTVESRQQTLELFDELEHGGVGTRLQTASEEASLAQAKAAIPTLESQIAATENQIALLLGRPPGPIRRSIDLSQLPAPPDHRVGLPAALLERRPDIRQAEANLVAANAQVGAAVASLLPQLSLNASGGFESSTLSTLFTSASETYGLSLLGDWLAPVLNGDKLRRQYRAQQANWRALVADYRRTVLGALGDVSNALINISKLHEARVQLEAQVRAETESLKLARDLFTAGTASYLDVVQAEQTLFPTQIQLAQTVGAQFVAEAQLYRALGGGWQMPPPKATVTTPASAGPGK
jgi:multidrug efflux system outer membrane protein